MLERTSDGLSIVPVIIEECDWRNVGWLKELESLPESGVPLAVLEEDERRRELGLLAVRVSEKLAEIDIPRGGIANAGALAIRGYLAQIVVTLLEALESGQDWKSVTLEPDQVSDKIDIFWHYPDKIKAVQVKSSIQPFQRTTVQRWARELQASIAADEYELILVGTVATPQFAKGLKIDKVMVPAAMVFDLTTFRQRVAHLLDYFMASQSLPSGNANYREMLADALVGKLATLAVSSQSLTREGLVALLKKWITLPPDDFSVFPVFDCPPRNPWFVGRENEIADLHERLPRTGQTTIGQGLIGLGGIGKTQTAIEYAHRYHEEYDAVLWVNAASELDIKAGYEKIAKLLRLPHDVNDPDNVLTAVKHWLGATDGHRWLLVFDGADDPVLLGAYLPGRAPSGHILVTSRMRLDSLGTRSSITIEKLPVVDSTRFLLDRAERALVMKPSGRRLGNWPMNSTGSLWPWSRQLRTCRPCASPTPSTSKATEPESLACWNDAGL